MTTMVPDQPKLGRLHWTDLQGNRGYGVFFPMDVIVVYGKALQLESKGKKVWIETSDGRTFDILP